MKKLGFWQARSLQREYGPYMIQRAFAFFVVLIFLIGCGGNSNNLQFPPQDPSQQSMVPVFRIAVLAPLSGGQSEFGLGIRNGAQLAVDQYNESRAPGQAAFELLAFDDQSDPEVGLQRAQEIVEVPGVVGLVGTYNSGVASQILPLMQSRTLPMLSPGNTDPALTVGSNPGMPERQFFNYFRLVVPDSLQGPALAGHAFTSEGFTRAVILSEDRAVSLALAQAFSDRFEVLGGEVLGFVIAPVGTQDYRSLLQSLDLDDADLLFYGGEVPNAALVKQQAVEEGFAGPLYGGDGVKDNSYLQATVGINNGDIATSLGAPAELLPSAADFLEAYAEAGFAEPPTDFGPYAYDAANLLIATSLASGGNGQGTISRLNAVDSQGATGRLAFDAFGDTLNRILTINEVVLGEFLPIQIVDLSE